MIDPQLAEIGIHLRAAAARRRAGVRRRAFSALLATVAVSAVALTAGGVSRDSEDAQAAQIVQSARVATASVPRDTRTMLHVVTRLEHSEGNGVMESWIAGDWFRRVGFHTDGSVHAEETLRPLSSGWFEYRAFHRERGGDVVSVARTRDPHAYNIDLIDPARDLRAAVREGELRFVGEALFEGQPTFELLLELGDACGVIQANARIYVRRDSYRPVAVRWGPALLRFLTVEEVPFDETRLKMGEHEGARMRRGLPPSRPAKSPCP